MISELQNLHRAFVMQTMPFGCWYCRDGRRVLFNRAYQPLWQRHGDGPAQPADPNEWVRDIRHQTTYFNVAGRFVPWRSSEAFHVCRDVLRDWGVLPAGMVMHRPIAPPKARPTLSLY